MEHPGQDHRDHRCGTARGHRRALRRRPHRVDDRLRAPRTAHRRQERGGGVAPPAADPVPRRPDYHVASAAGAPTGLSGRMGDRYNGIRGHRSPLRGAGHGEPAPQHRQAHRTRPAPVRHLARAHLPRRGVLRRSRAQPHRGVQAMVVDASDTEHGQTAQPGQHQKRPDQPALLSHPHHRVGVPEPAHPAADVPRRPAHHRQAAATLPRRRRRDETVALRTR